MMTKAFTLLRPKGLPKSATLRVMRTVRPDVSLNHRSWVLHHRKVNHIELR